MAVAERGGWIVAFYGFETIAASVIIWFACDPFAEAAQWLGRKLHVPGSIRGATLDAVASSMPELFVGILFVAEFKDFGASVATCAGSAMYNMVLIPAVCAIAISFGANGRSALKVSREVIVRDGLWFVAAEAFLVYCLFEERIAVWSALVLLAIYVSYLVHLWRHAATHRRKKKLSVAEGDVDDGDGMPTHVRVLGGVFQPRLNWTTCILVLLLSTAVVGGISHSLVVACEKVSEALAVPSFLVAVIVVAAASSVPDTLLSIGAARRGDDSGAVSNAFGSNTFDVTICLSVPVLIHAVQYGGELKLEHDAGVAPLGLLLVALSILTLLIMRWRYSIGRGKAIMLIAIYLVFVLFAMITAIA